MSEDKVRAFICGYCGRATQYSGDMLERYCPECRPMLEKRGMLYRRKESRPRSHA